MDVNLLDSAETYFKQTIALFDGDTTATDMQTYPNETLGMLYIEEAKYELATQYFLEALRISKAIDKKPGIAILYLRLYDLYQKQGKIDSSNYYLRLYTILNDSLTLAEKQSIPTAVNKLREYDINTISILNYRTSKSPAAILVLTLIILGVLTVNKYRLSESKKKLNTKRKVIGKLVKEIELNASPRNIDNLVQLALDSNPAFLTEFHSYFPDFEKQLMDLAAPRKFVASEIEICALMKLNFDTKEMARITNSSVRSIESKKYRVRKKLELPKEEDLTMWMNKI